MPARPYLVLAAVTLAACAPLPPPPVMDFQPEGSIHVSTDQKGDKEAAYSSDRIVARGVNLTRGPDGRWTGTFGGAEGALQVTAERIAGPGLDVAVTRRPELVSIEGQVAGKPVELTLSAKGMGGWSDGRRCQFDFIPVGGGGYKGFWGCPNIPVMPGGGASPSAPRAEVKVTGPAAFAAPSPQLELVLLSVLPPY
ncbi:MAG: hypothetical protein QM767_09775 [Anaeromyxobacter sp.]